jgi:nicotinate-nucleotide pyrophosphorylase
MNLSPEEKPYLPAVEEFLQQMDGQDVDAVCLIALGRGDESHLLCTWRCEPWILAKISGILQLTAAHHMMLEYEEEKENDDEDPDE